MRLLFLLLSACAGGAPPAGEAALPPPRVTAVAITPAEPEPGEALFCAAGADQVLVAFGYHWVVDGLAGGWEGAVIPEDTTEAGQAWTCKVTPVGEGGRGEPASASVSIAAPEDTGPPPNTPPGAPGIVIHPGTPAPGEPLDCVLRDPAEDPDGDELSYAYAWTVDGEPAGLAVAEVPPGRVADDEVWTCAVAAFDGQDWGPTVSASASVQGCGGGSLAFTGADHVVVASDPGLDLGGGPLTLEAYAKLDGAAPDARLVVVARHDPGLGGWWLGVVREGGGFRLALGVDDATLRGPAVPTGRWVHVAATWAAGEVVLYVDGQGAEPQAAPAPPDVAVPLRIGALRPPGSEGVPEDEDGGWQGLLDQVHLSTLRRYEADFVPPLQVPADADSLVYYDFVEGAGSETADEGASGAHPGTLVGPTWTNDSPCLGGR